MSKVLLWIISIIVTLGLIIAVTYFYLTSKKTASQITIVQDIPQELSDNFDPTVNSPIFKVNSVDKKTEVFELEYIFPSNLEGTKVTSSLICDKEDIKFTDNTTQNPETISLSLLINKINSSLDKVVHLTGLCTDKNCTKIYKGCNLSIS